MLAKRCSAVSLDGDGGMRPRFAEAVEVRHPLFFDDGDGSVGPVACFGGSLQEFEPGAVHLLEPWLRKAAEDHYPVLKSARLLSGFMVEDMV